MMANAGGEDSVLGKRGREVDSLMSSEETVTQPGWYDSWQSFHTLFRPTYLDGEQTGLVHHNR